MGAGCGVGLGAGLGVGRQLGVRDGRREKLEWWALAQQDLIRAGREGEPRAEYEIWIAVICLAGVRQGSAGVAAGSGQTLAIMPPKTAQRDQVASLAYMERGRSWPMLF